MRQITSKIVSAFIARRRASSGNTTTDGQALFLHGSKIAEHREDGMYVTLAGWNTPTTRERLNAIPGVRFNQKNFSPLYNGKPCDSYSWIKVQ